MKRFFISFIVFIGISFLSKGYDSIDQGWINVSNSSNKDISLRFVKAEGTPLLELKIISNEIAKVLPENTLMFRSKDGGLLQLRPSQVYNDTNNSDLTVIYEGNLDFFKNNIPTYICLNYDLGEIDITVLPATGNLINRSYKHILSSKIENKVIKINRVNEGNVHKFKFEFYKCLASKSNWTLKKIKTETMTQKEADEIAHEWDSQSDDKYIYQCIVRKLK